MAAGSRRLSLDPYRVSAAVILIAGLVSAFVIYRATRQHEEERLEQEFVQRVILRHAVTREALNRYTESLIGLGVIFRWSDHVDLGEFMRASEHLQLRLPGAVAFEWAPEVAHAQRAELEAAMQRQYAPRHFEIADFARPGGPRRASDRPSYYPICYIHPLEGNEVALGYDIANGLNREALEQARLSRQLVVSGQFQLIQDAPGKMGLIMIWPVYKPLNPHALPTPAEPDAFAGFLLGVFHSAHLFKTLAETQVDPVIEMLFIDRLAADPARRILFKHAPSSGEPDEETAFQRAAPFLRELPLALGQREWRVLYRPSANWVNARRTLSPTFRGFSILALSGLLAGLVSVVGRRAQFIRAQVEQRTAELTESRRMFANLVHALPGMAFRARYENRFEMVFTSDGAFPLTGWTAAEFLGGQVAFRDIIHPDDVDRVRRDTRAALAAKEDLEIQYRIRTKGGDEKWVLSRGRGVYDEQGKLQLVEGLLIDVTASKTAEANRLAMERKLLEGQKLESLGLLAGGVAHDFNNLLSAILGNASLARLSIPPGNQADPQLKAIETASLRAAELCRQMLAYAGKGRFVVERVDVSSLVADILPLLRVSIARSANLNLDLGKELPGVKADATQLRQIVMNLVLNAVDALAGRNGEIRIRTSVASIDRPLLTRCVTGAGLPEGEYVTLEISDTGCGMSADVLNKIFDPFFTTKVSGRGLGLAAVLGIVRGHNGAMQVESAVGRGTTFRLYLPAIVGESLRAEPPKSGSATPWLQTGDVLVIEDEDPVRAVMVQLLESFGFKAYPVSDGRAGVERFREDAGRWRLVVIDLLMPGMTGEETLGAIRAIRADVRVLLVSGFSETEVLKRVSGAPLVFFLPKPFKRDTFEQKLKQMLG